MTDSNEIDQLVARLAPMQGLGAGELPPREPLRECVRDAVETFFATLDGQAPRDLYRMVLAEVEAPLLDTVMRQAGGNQTRAADMLGMTRATLRKKLKIYQID